MQLPLTDDEKKFQIKDAWDAPFESWATFNKRIDDSVRQAKVSYKNRVQNLLKDRGWDASPIKQQEKFLWLALYQVKRWSANKIATQLRPDLVDPDSTIYKAVKATAKLIKLRLRERKQSGAK